MISAGNSEAAGILGVGLVGVDCDCDVEDPIPQNDFAKDETALSVLD